MKSSAVSSIFQTKIISHSEKSCQRSKNTDQTSGIHQPRLDKLSINSVIVENTGERE